MTGTQALAGRAAIGVVAGMSGVWAARSRRLMEVGAVQFERWVTWSFVGSRLALFALLFLFLRILPRGDVPGFYTPEAAAVLQHQVPYLDFVSSYAPMHPYMDAVPFSLWHSPLSILLFAILVEVLVLPLWFRLGREFLPVTAVRTAALLYLTSPISLQYVTVDGQDNVIIAVLLAISILLLIRGRTIGSGAAVGLSVCLTKVIPLVFAPVFFLTIRHRWRWGVAMLGLVVGVYGTFALEGLPMLAPLKIEGALKTAGNVPYLIEALTGYTVSNGVWNGLTMLALSVVWAVIWRAGHGADDRARLRVIAFGMVATATTVMMFSKKSWPAYLMLVLFPLYVLFADRRLAKLWLLAGFSVVVAIEHSVWATLLIEIRATALHQRMMAGEPVCWVLLLLEVLLVTGYGWLLWMAIGAVRTAKVYGDSAGTKNLSSGSGDAWMGEVVRI